MLRGFFLRIKLMGTFNYLTVTPFLSYIPYKKIILNKGF